MQLCVQSSGLSSRLPYGISVSINHTYAHVPIFGWPIIPEAHYCTGLLVQQSNKLCQTYADAVQEVRVFETSEEKNCRQSYI